MISVTNDETIERGIKCMKGCRRRFCFLFLLMTAMVLPQALGEPLPYMRVSKPDGIYEGIGAFCFAKLRQLYPTISDEDFHKFRISHMDDIGPYMENEPYHNQTVRVTLVYDNIDSISATFVLDAEELYYKGDSTELLYIPSEDLGLQLAQLHSAKVQKAEAVQIARKYYEELIESQSTTDAYSRFVDRHGKAALAFNELKLVYSFYEADEGSDPCWEISMRHPYDTASSGYYERTEWVYLKVHAMTGDIMATEYEHLFRDSLCVPDGMW